MSHLRCVTDYIEEFGDLQAWFLRNHHPCQRGFLACTIIMWFGNYRAVLVKLLIKIHNGWLGAASSTLFSNQNPERGRVSVQLRPSQLSRWSPQFWLGCMPVLPSSYTISLEFVSFKLFFTSFPFGRLHLRRREPRMSRYRTSFLRQICIPP